MPIAALSKDWCPGKSSLGDGVRYSVSVLEDLIPLMIRHYQQYVHSSVRLRRHERHFYKYIALDNAGLLCVSADLSPRDQICAAELGLSDGFSIAVQNIGKRIAKNKSLSAGPQIEKY